MRGGGRSRHADEAREGGVHAITWQRAGFGLDVGRKLGWQPRVTFTELIQMMVRADEADVRGAIARRAPRM